MLSIGCESLCIHFGVSLIQQVKEKEGEAEEGEEQEPAVNTDPPQTAEKKREIWRMAHYRTNDKNV